MEIQRIYRCTGIPVSKVRYAIDLLGGSSSSVIGVGWAHNIREWRLSYESQQLVCHGVEEMRAAVAKNGDTLRYCVSYQSNSGRIVNIDATDGTRIAVKVVNGEYTMQLLEKIEQVLELHVLPRRVFLSHGRSAVWTRVQTFIEKETFLNLEAIEFEQRPKGGRTIAQKLQDESEQCSYAVVVITGDDLDDKGEPHMRENVMHEIGFFQGRYGFDRVCLLREEGVTIPSNLSGFLYESFPKGDVASALVGLQRELRNAFPLAK